MCYKVLDTPLSYYCRITQSIVIITAWKVSKYGIISGPYTENLDTFHAVHVEYLLVLMSPFAWMFLCFLYLMEFFIKVFHEGFQLTFTFLKSTTIETPEKR